MGRGGGRSGGGGGHRSGGGSHRSGGGSHRTSHTTVHHSHTTVHVSSGGGGGGDGKGNTCVAGMFCLVVGVILTIVAVIIAVGDATEEKEYCNYVETLNRNEQAICTEKDSDDDELYVSYDPSGERYVHIYKAKKGSIASRTTHRQYTWVNYSMSLSSHHYDTFSVSSSLGVEAEITINMDRSYSSENYLKFYWLTGEQYYKAISPGYFNEDKYDPKYNRWSQGPNTIKLSGKENEFYYMVFSSYYGIDFTYDVVLDYTVYDMSGQEETRCTGYQCKFDMHDDDIVVAEYAPVQSTSATPNSGDGPEYFEINFYNLDVDWSGILAGMLTTLLIAVFFYILAIVFLYKYLKKIGKLGKKVAKKVEKAAEENAAKSTQMETVVVQPTPAGDPNYAAAGAPPGYAAAGAPPQAYPAAQPYPTDPNYANASAPQAYPGQAYPGQPYDPNYAAAQPYPGQAYPGQPATVNPV